MLLEDWGARRSRTAIHDWVQKADIQPAGGERLDRGAVDQKSIRINDGQYWLYGAVNPETNRIPHSRLFPTYTISAAREFLIDDADDLIGGLRKEGLSYRIQPHGYRNQVEGVFKKGKATNMIVLRLFQPRRSTDRGNLVVNPRYLVESMLKLTRPRLALILRETRLNHPSELLRPVIVDPR